jgi:uncharacterized protein (DUF433 family)
MRLTGPVERHERGPGSGLASRAAFRAPKVERPEAFMIRCNDEAKGPSYLTWVRLAFSTGSCSRRAQRGHMEGKRRDLSLYGGRDPREMPIYTLDEAAFILCLARSTLQAWTFGSRWKERSSGRARSYEPLIFPPPRPEDSNRLMLSFINLVEAHVLYAIRRVHKIKMSRVREAMVGLRHDFESRHPLAEVDLYTEGTNIITRYGAYVNMSQGKQVEMAEVISIYTKRIERDESAIARFYPFSGEPVVSGPGVVEQPKIVAVDPFVSFGRPTVVGTNVRTEILAERWLGGDSIETLANDYQLDKTVVENALKYESAHRPTEVAT